jgi:hypothetical protein
MRKFYIILLSLLLPVIVLAQKNGTIKGIAFDTLSKKPVDNATITVLEKKDSSLVTFTMTGPDGKFELKGIPNGEYRLMITHVSYHNNNSPFAITDANKNLDLGNIVMHDAVKTLKEAVVVAEAPPVTLVDDTIQYNAGSFKTPPNSSVEQLLKKLPGIKVEKDGTVKAQGEKVNRVLVDGKEFFGNDPKVATKNLPADAVDKVQVYDRQSDQAQLTGFDDGNSEKTINLKLKKDKKKGVFGKINGGAGDQERYAGKFNVNSFKGARQFSAIGMANNTNTDGFSFMDILNFTGELARMQKGGNGGNVSISMSADEAAALGAGGTGNRGINTIRGGGLNYNNIIGTRLDFQSNYFYNRSNPEIKSQTFRENIIGDRNGTTQGRNFYNEDAYSNNINGSHRFNLNNLYEIDSFHSIRFNPGFSYQRSTSLTEKSFSTLDGNKNLINSGLSNSNSLNEGYSFKGDLVFRKKFNRKGRTFSLSLGTTLNESDGEGNNNSIIEFYNAGIPLGSDTLDQHYKTKGSLRGYTARAVYTEPLWKRSLLEFSAGGSKTTSTSDKTTWDYNKVNGKYDSFNDLLSNNYENNYEYGSAGFRIRNQRKKFIYSLGVNLQKALLEGKIISGVKDSVIKQSFTNLLPNARFQYNFSRFRNFSLNYSASTNQPSITQLQPVPDLTNPLYIREGNPDLKQEYSHNLQANLHLVSPYKNKNLFGFFSLQATSNKIVNYDSIDLQTGIRKSKPVNVNGVYNLNNNLSYSLPVRFLNGSVEISNNLGYQKNRQFINGLMNDIRTLSLRPDLRFDINPNEKLNISLTAGLSYTKSKYSLASDYNTEFISRNYEASADWQLPAKFFLSSDFSFVQNKQLSAGFNQEIPIWNASLSRQVLRFNRGEIKLAVNDILNRNTGIYRNSSQSYIEDVRVNTLKRFFLLSFTYSLSKTGLMNESGGNMRVIMR